MDSSIPIPSLIGQTVGNWHILRQLGAGAFGAVYEAQHQAISERRAAVKVLHPHLSTDAVVQRRFINEANAASKIEHQNIIQIYDGGVTDSGVCYVVMELISGHSLETILSKGRLTPARAVQLTAQIASALGAAHAAGIVHRGCAPAPRRRAGLFRVGRKRRQRPEKSRPRDSGLPAQRQTRNFPVQSRLTVIYAACSEVT